MHANYSPYSLSLFMIMLMPQLLGPRQEPGSCVVSIIRGLCPNFAEGINPCGSVEKFPMGRGKQDD